MSPEGSDCEDVQSLIKVPHDREGKMGQISKDRIGKSIMNSYIVASQDRGDKRSGQPNNILSEGEEDLLQALDTEEPHQTFTTPAKQKAKEQKSGWDIDQLRNAIIKLNEDDDYRSMVELFR